MIDSKKLELKDSDKKKARKLVRKKGNEEFIDWVIKDKEKYSRKEQRIIVLTNFFVISLGRNKKNPTFHICRQGFIPYLSNLNFIDKENMELRFNNPSFILKFFHPKCREIATKILTSYQILTRSQINNDLVNGEIEIPSVNFEPDNGDHFINIYKGFSSFYNSKPHQEIIQFVENMKENPDLNPQKILDLAQFKFSEELSKKSTSIYPILSTFKFNTFFSGIKISGFHDQIFTKIEETEFLLKNKSLKSLVISGTNDRIISQKLGEQLENNEEIQINHLNISFNPVDLKSNIFKGIESLHSGLLHLDLSFCWMKPKMVEALFRSLSNNPKHRQLQVLNLSNNSFSTKGTEAFGEYLKSLESNHLKMLYLSSSNLKLENFFKYLQQYCTRKLVYLNISKNTLQRNDYKSLSDFLADSRALSEFDLSYTNFLPQKCQQLIETIVTNAEFHNFVLNLSHNKLKEAGAQGIAFSLGKDRSNTLAELVLDSTSLGTKGAQILFADNGPLCGNRSITRLSISANFPSSESKQCVKYLANLLLPNSPVKYLRMRGDKRNYLGLSMTEFLKKLPDSNLLGLDIQGNYWMKFLTSMNIRSQEDPILDLIEQLQKEELTLQYFNFDDNFVSYSFLHNIQKANIKYIEWSEIDSNRIIQKFHKVQNMTLPLQKLQKKAERIRQQSRFNINEFKSTFFITPDNLDLDSNLKRNVHNYIESLVLQKSKFFKIDCETNSNEEEINNSKDN
ncbi:capping protein arp2/3 and myosin-i linker protein [Anaeramoeba ignava]|uniref:Capping protein arp2/3 and myosin-i linker protein n=1 Tax=Anaeramoeba ignava TaxID=1746090 RepID=A0A9Q0LA30_ANAIG|nr:capping protein arp2/3 and myosin-i linker protein [Anaeramoeba ignava]|eukprot:Anaeramoba_ignava/a90418_259.p1 GENE.a90418_259~~a90418_259.p1  ORF type:complete len:737 (-),score=236.24 a90418_259:63-2273(-)